MDKRARYITTTLPYVNADPHIGFALEIVQADSLARFWRLTGHEVFFSTGTDEHGQKISQKAQEEGRDIQEYTDHYAGEFQKLKDTLGLSYDTFIRTTQENHKAAAQELWKRCEAAGDIYKKSYKGLYCVGDEMFLRDADLVDGKCPNHPNMEPQEIEEENWFFALSKYEDRLLEYLNKPGSVVPDWRREEAINFVKSGLEDLSISRDKSRLSWGVPVPGDDTQVMYVWFDALTNYISTTGWPEDADGNFKKFWEEGQTLQLAGKDQIRFQSIIWQAMLMSGGVSATDTVFYHGFITSGGQKMSKSLGNVISPFELVEKYGVDATRYMLLRHVHPVDDSDVTWEKLDEWYTAHLVNGLGNLVSRTMKMAESYKVEYNGPITWEDYIGSDTDFHNYPGNWGGHYDSFDFQRAANQLWERIQALDEFIQAEEPFKTIKTDEKKSREDIAYLLSHLYRIGFELEPIMPKTAVSIRETIQKNKKPENLFPRL